MTLAELAGDSLSVALVSKIERGLVNPSLPTLDHLAHRLGVTLSALFDDGTHSRAARLAEAHDAARARLLLGDPSGAAADSSAAVEEMQDSVGSTGPEVDALRSRLLGVAAEATFLAGQPGPAARLLMEASAAASAGGSAQASLVQAELAWVLGLLERRRGALADAQRTHTGALAILEAGTPAHPWWQYLRAGILSELGGLAEARGDFSLARDLIVRGASIAAGVAQASVPAHALLDEWSASSGANALAVSPSTGSVSPSASAAFALAVTAAADRLVRRLTQEAARLERAASTPVTPGQLWEASGKAERSHLA